MDPFIYNTFVYPIIYIWPAYVTNGLPVVFGGTWLFKKVGRPMDGGRKFMGWPIFGKNKTWRGLIGGLACGFLMSAIEGYFLPWMLVIGILMSIGAHIGDLLGSFIKRRWGTSASHSHFWMDSYLFLIFALLLAYPSGNLPTLYGLIFIVLLTGVLHRATNVGAFLLKIKKVPW